ncbi:AAA family ATPase [Solibaculum mannosilyticum]|uniref:AAA family ATPase n=1 Tax=Solibaculum mannosilyticum TaxID=2780922 RepID=UPI0007A897D5|nr:recombination protein F [Eubacteriaceae bacterium CHKCI005]
MFITQLNIENFKSIAHIEMNFTPLTILVGANASGKSNLINVFRFISDIATDGIDNAIAMQGGIPYLTNASLPKGTPIKISFTIDLTNEGWIRSSNVKNIALEIHEIKYQFIIQPNIKGGGYHIVIDNLELGFECMRINSSAKRENLYTPMNIKYSLIFERKSQKSSISYDCYMDDNCPIDEESKIKLKNDITAQVFARICNENRKELMLYRAAILLPSFFSEDTFIRIFDFDPKELKKSSSMASMRILEENGSNIASVLQNILRLKENRKKLTVILNEYLPFIDAITIENNFDKSFSYKVKESFSNREFHANFLSDGTVSLLAIVIALYFEEMSNIIILEEPERNIHPKLLAKILASAEDISFEKQVIITTHNPEFLKHAKIEDVKLIQRNTEGFTLASVPTDSETIKCFLRNDLGLDDLFLQGILGE